MSTYIRRTCCSSWFCGVLLLALAATNSWGDTDKTVVDLERDRPEAASRYHRPRAAHLYHYDKTEVDLAVPLTQQSPEEPRPAQRPEARPPATPGAETSPAPAPLPTNISPQTPLPDGGR